MKRLSRKPSEACRRKMSEAKKGAKNPRYGKTVEDSTKKKISQALKKYSSNIPNK